MAKPMIREHNIETDEIIDREMTNEEYQIYLQNLEQAEQEAQLLNQAVQEKETARASALAKLAALGLTEDEIAAL